jgi:hypothetical protein
MLYDGPASDSSGPKPKKRKSPARTTPSSTSTSAFEGGNYSISATPRPAPQAKPVSKPKAVTPKPVSIFYNQWDVDLPDRVVDPTVVRRNTPVNPETVQQGRTMLDFLRQYAGTGPEAITSSEAITSPRQSEPSPASTLADLFNPDSPIFRNKQEKDNSAFKELIENVKKGAAASTQPRNPLTGGPIIPDRYMRENDKKGNPYDMPYTQETAAHYLSDPGPYPSDKVKAMNSLMYHQLKDQKSYVYDTTLNRADKIKDFLDQAGDDAYEGKFDTLRERLEKNPDFLNIPSYQELYNRTPESVMEDWRKEKQQYQNDPYLMDAMGDRVNQIIGHLKDARDYHRDARSMVREALTKLEDTRNEAIEYQVDKKDLDEDTVKPLMPDFEAREKRNLRATDKIIASYDGGNDAIEHLNRFGADIDPRRRIDAQQDEVKKTLGVKTLPSVEEMLIALVSSGDVDINNPGEVKKMKERLENPLHPITRSLYLGFSRAARPEEFEHFNEKWGLIFVNKAIKDYQTSERSRQIGNAEAAAAKQKHLESDAYDLTHKSGEGPVAQWFEGLGDKFEQLDDYTLKDPDSVHKFLPVVGTYLSAGSDSFLTEERAKKKADKDYNAMGALGVGVDFLSRTLYASAAAAQSLYALDSGEESWTNVIPGVFGGALDPATGSKLFDSADEIIANPGKSAKSVGEAIWDQITRPVGHVDPEAEVTPITFGHVIAQEASADDKQNFRDSHGYQIAAGLGLDLLIDPINFVGLGVVGNAIKHPQRMARIESTSLLSQSSLRPTHAMKDGEVFSRFPLNKSDRQVPLNDESAVNAFNFDTKTGNMSYNRETILRDVVERSGGPQSRSTLELLESVNTPAMGAGAAKAEEARVVINNLSPDSGVAINTHPLGDPGRAPQAPFSRKDYGAYASEEMSYLSREYNNDIPLITLESRGIRPRELDLKARSISQEIEEVKVLQREVATSVGTSHLMDKLRGLRAQYAPHARASKGVNEVRATRILRDSRTLNTWKPHGLNLHNYGGKLWSTIIKPLQGGVPIEAGWEGRLSRPVFADTVRGQEAAAAWRQLEELDANPASTSAVLEAERGVETRPADPFADMEFGQRKRLEDRIDEYGAVDPVTGKPSMTWETNVEDYIKAGAPGLNSSEHIDLVDLYSKASVPAIAKEDFPFTQEEIMLSLVNGMEQAAKDPAKASELKHLTETLDTAKRNYEKAPSDRAKRSAAKMVNSARNALSKFNVDASLDYLDLLQARRNGSPHLADEAYQAKQEEKFALIGQRFPLVKIRDELRKMLHGKDINELKILENRVKESKKVDSLEAARRERRYPTHAEIAAAKDSDAAVIQLVQSTFKSDISPSRVHNVLNALPRVLRAEKYVSDLSTRAARDGGVSIREVQVARINAERLRSRLMEFPHAEFILRNQEIVQGIQDGSIKADALERIKKSQGVPVSDKSEGIVPWTEALESERPGFVETGIKDDFGYRNPERDYDTDIEDVPLHEQGTSRFATSESSYNDFTSADDFLDFVHYAKDEDGLPTGDPNYRVSAQSLLEAKQGVSFDFGTKQNQIQELIKSLNPVIKDLDNQIAALDDIKPPLVGTLNIPTARNIQDMLSKTSAFRKADGTLDAAKIQAAIKVKTPHTGKVNPATGKKEGQAKEGHIEVSYVKPPEPKKPEHLTYEDFQRTPEWESYQRDLVFLENVQLYVEDRANKLYIAGKSKAYFANTEYIENEFLAQIIDEFWSYRDPSVDTSRYSNTDARTVLGPGSPVSVTPSKGFPERISNPSNENLNLPEVSQRPAGYMAKNPEGKPEFFPESNPDSIVYQLSDGTASHVGESGPVGRSQAPAASLDAPREPLRPSREGTKLPIETAPSRTGRAGQEPVSVKEGGSKGNSDPFGLNEVNRKKRQGQGTVSRPGEVVKEGPAVRALGRRPSFELFALEHPAQYDDAYGVIDRTGLADSKDWAPVGSSPSKKINLDVAYSRATGVRSDQASKATDSKVTPESKTASNDAEALTKDGEALKAYLIKAYKKQTDDPPSPQEVAEFRRKFELHAQAQARKTKDKTSTEKYVRNPKQVLIEKRVAQQQAKWDKAYKRAVEQDKAEFERLLAQPKGRNVHNNPDPDGFALSLAESKKVYAAAAQGAKSEIVDLISKGSIPRVAGATRLPLGDVVKAEAQFLRHEMEVKRLELQYGKEVAIAEQNLEQVAHYNLRLKELAEQRKQLSRDFKKFNLEARATAKETLKRVKEENVLQMLSVPARVDAKQLQLHILGMKMNLGYSENMFRGMELVEKMVPAKIFNAYSEYFYRPTKLLSEAESITMRARYESSAPKLIQSHLKQLSYAMRDTTVEQRKQYLNTYMHDLPYNGLDADKYASTSRVLDDIMKIINGTHEGYMFKNVRNTAGDPVALRIDEINRYLPEEYQIDTKQLRVIRQERLKNDSAAAAARTTKESDLEKAIAEGTVEETAYGYRAVGTKEEWGAVAKSANDSQVPISVPQMNMLQALGASPDDVARIVGLGRNKVKVQKAVTQLKRELQSRPKLRPKGKGQGDDFATLPEPTGEYILDDVMKAIMGNGHPNPDDLMDPFRLGWVMSLASDQAANLKALEFSIGDTFGVARPSRDRLTMWNKLEHTHGWVRGEGNLSNYMFPPEVATDIRRLIEMTDPKHSAPMMRMFDQAQGYWKQGMTIYNPAYYARNGIGEMMTSWLDGVNHPKWYRKAREVVKYLDNEHGELARLVEDLADVAGRTKTGRVRGSKDVVTLKGGTKVNIEEVLYQYHYVHGLGSTFVNTDLGKGVRGLANQSLNANPVRKRLNAANNKVHGMGENYEDWLRMAHFLHALEASGKGTLTEASKYAASRVTRSHFDYTDFSRFEKSVMLRPFPFYKWIRRGAPLMMAHLFMTPGKMAALPKTLNAYSNLGFDPVNAIQELSDKVLGTEFNDDPIFNTQDILEDKNGTLPNYTGIAPKWVRDLFAYQLQPAADDEYANYMRISTPQVDGLTGITSFIQDWSEEGVGGLGDTPAYSLLSPFIKAPVELLRNKSLQPESPYEIRGGDYNEYKGINDVEATAAYVARQASPWTSLWAKLSKDNALPFGNIGEGESNRDLFRDLVSFGTGIGFYRSRTDPIPKDDNSPVGSNTPAVGIRSLSEVPMITGRAGPAPVSKEMFDVFSAMSEEGPLTSTTEGKGSGWKNYSKRSRKGWKNYSKRGPKRGSSSPTLSVFDLLGFLQQLSEQVEADQVVDTKAFRRDE